MSVTVTLKLDDEEALALAAVIRGLRPPDTLAKLWYGAIDQLSPQLPTARYDALTRDYQFNGDEERVTNREICCQNCYRVDNFPDTSYYLWHGRRPDVSPAVLNLCRLCHNAALQELLTP